MKIYCILFDTVPRHPKIKNVLEKKDINFADHITCSSTVPTLVTMLSGKTPTEMFGIGGIGHSHTYSKLLSEKKSVEEWDSKIILHMLPSDWNIHIHSMPETRGDETTQQMVNSKDLEKGGFSRIKIKSVKNIDGFRLLPDDLCGRTRNMNFYQ